MIIGRRSLSALGLACALFISCAEKDDAAPPDEDAGTGADDAGSPKVDAGEEPPNPPPGALIEVSLSSTVGVVLDELPEGATREQAAAALLAEDDAFWISRAKAQVRYTLYRLTFRHYFYEGKGQLPLPPEETWTITLAPGAPVRATIDGHDLVARRYSLGTALVTTSVSVQQAEPELMPVGGIWREPFVLPVDPELLFQRTGFACMDESEYPLNSVDGENAWQFYDQDCEVETQKDASCHLTALPTESCIQALEHHVGKVETGVEFRRVSLDETRAASVRVGPVTWREGADLRVLPEGLADRRVIYRYIPADSCALAERCVAGPGWRRLLQFTASVHNVGGRPLHIGDVNYFLTDPSVPSAAHNLYEYSDCHAHYHFTHYGTFTFTPGSTLLGGKKAFCLESTSRYSNNESSPLVTPYGRCEYQGIEAGWGDDYQAGIECQWIDVTGVATATRAVTGPLAFASNPDDFLCEGTPVLDASGGLTWERTSFTTEAGAPVDRIACNFVPNHAANNLESTAVTIPPAGEGLITSPCTRGQVGPLRDCGFSIYTPLSACTPGGVGSLEVTSLAGDPVTFRVCEASTVLQAGTACVHRDALAQVSTATTTRATFTCPGPRSKEEPGGLVTIYSAPLTGL